MSEKKPNPFVVVLKQLFRAASAIVFILFIFLISIVLFNKDKLISSINQGDRWSISGIDKTTVTVKWTPIIGNDTIIRYEARR